MKTNCDKCGSSDAKHVYEDHEFCFSCNTRFRLGDSDDQPDTSMDFSGTTDVSKPIVVTIVIIPLILWVVAEFRNK